MFMWKFAHIELVFSEFLILILWMKTLIKCVTIKTKAFDLVLVKQKQAIIVWIIVCHWVLFGNNYLYSFCFSLKINSFFFLINLLISRHHKTDGLAPDY